MQILLGGGNQPLGSNARRSDHRAPDERAGGSLKRIQFASAGDWPHFETDPLKLLTLLEQLQHQLPNRGQRTAPLRGARDDQSPLELPTMVHVSDKECWMSLGAEYSARQALGPLMAELKRLKDAQTQSE